MDKVFLYHAHDHAAQSFYKNDCAPTEDFCFFSTLIDAQKHLYRQYIENWHPNEDDTCNWAKDNVWICDNDGYVMDFKDPDQLSSDTISEFVNRSDNNDLIIEIPVN